MSDSRKEASSPLHRPDPLPTIPTELQPEIAAYYEQISSGNRDLHSIVMDSLNLHARILDQTDPLSSSGRFQTALDQMLQSDQVEDTVNRARFAIYGSRDSDPPSS